MSTSISTSSMKGSGTSVEPLSPLSPAPDAYNIYFSGFASLSQRTDPVAIKFLVLAEKISELAHEIAKLKEKTTFIFNYLTQHPGDHFYYCSKCQKWRSMFIEKQVKQVKSKHSHLFNLYCPTCDKSCLFGPNKDIKVVIAEAQKNRILMVIPRDPQSSGNSTG